MRTQDGLVNGMRNGLTSQVDVMMFVKMCTFFDRVLTMTVSFSKRSSVMARCFSVTALVYCIFESTSGIWRALLAPFAALFQIISMMDSRLSFGRTYRWV